MSGDGIGEFETSSGRDRKEDIASLASTFDSIARSNGTATSVSVKEHERIITSVVQLFYKSASADNRRKVEDTLIYYFAVHGTSPDTAWASSTQDVIVEGIPVPAIKVVETIRLEQLKKFMSHYEVRAIKAIQASVPFANAMKERAARAQLQPGQEFYAIDYVGKGGALSNEEMAIRVVSKDKLLNHRSRNVKSISSVRQNDNASRLVDSRSGFPGQSSSVSFD